MRSAIAFRCSTTPAALRSSCCDFPGKSPSCLVSKRRCANAWSSFHSSGIASFVKVRAVEKLEPKNDLTLVSNYVPGKRLSEGLAALRGPAFAMWLIRDLVPALAELQAAGARGGARRAHGRSDCADARWPARDRGARPRLGARAPSTLAERVVGAFWHRRPSHGRRQRGAGLPDRRLPAGTGRPVGAAWAKPRVLRISAWPRRSAGPFSGVGGPGVAGRHFGCG